MKLYATVNSERGKTISKSGNDYLMYEVIDENKDKLITLHITACTSNLRGKYYNIYITNHQSEYIDIT